MFEYKTMLDVFAARRGQTERGFTFLDYQARPTFLSFERLLVEAEQRASYFQALGAKPRDRIGVMVVDVAEFVLSFLGALRAGAVPVPMYPLLRANEHHIRSASEILRNARPRLLIADFAPDALQQAARAAGVAQVLSSADVVRGAAAAGSAGLSEEPILRPDDACFVQFTSGSTAAPKGVVVTHENLLANGYAIMHDGLACDPAVDIGVCWLPLYHDMGLIGHVLAPLMIGAAVVFMPPLAFLARPSMWMEAVHKYRGTTIFGPNFALGLAARRTERIESLDLSCLRVVGCGAEPIHPRTLRTFVDAFRVAGLRPEAIAPCYGLAEATLAVTVASPARSMRTVLIDREAYERGRVQPAAVDAGSTLELVSCGRPLGRHQVAILDAEGRPVAQGSVGEIAVQGPSVTTSYLEGGSAISNASGWLLTGDLGFLLDGELFVSGRKKDMLIVDGKNYYPQSLEWLIEELPGVRRGAVVAFSVAGSDTEAVVIVAEKTPQADRDQIAREIRRQLRTGVGLAAGEVVVVDAGEVPKTSSGKLQRQLAKQMYGQRAFSPQRGVTQNVPADA